MTGFLTTRLISIKIIFLFEKKLYLSCLFLLNFRGARYGIPSREQQTGTGTGFRGKDAAGSKLDPLVTNGLFHSNQLDVSIFAFRGIGSNFSFLFQFSMKMNSPRWDAAFCSVTSAAILFAYIRYKGVQAYMG